MAQSLFADPDSAAVPHLGGSRPGNDVPFARFLICGSVMLYRRNYGNIMLYLAAGVLYRRIANKGVAARSGARLWLIRGKD